MNAKQKLHQLHLQQWADRFQDQASSALAVKVAAPCRKGRLPRIQHSGELDRKVNAFLAWSKKILSDMAAQGQTAKALQYCINQEQYLRIFLSDLMPWSEHVQKQCRAQRKS